MSDVIKVLGADFPPCAHPGCRKHGEDGYCMATCCWPPLKAKRAYCSEHSHRPTRVLEILGHPPTQQTFTRDEVLDIVRSMWTGAGLVYEAEGHFALKRDLDAARLLTRAQTPAGVAVVSSRRPITTEQIEIFRAHATKRGMTLEAYMNELGLLGPGTDGEPGAA